MFYVIDTEINTITVIPGTESEKANESKNPPVPPGQSASALTPPDAKTVTFMTGGETLVVLHCSAAILLNVILLFDPSYTLLSYIVLSCVISLF
jgi:hypothetical protein